MIGLIPVGLSIAIAAGANGMGTDVASLRVAPLLLSMVAGTILGGIAAGIGLTLVRCGHPDWIQSSIILVALGILLGCTAWYLSRAIMYAVFVSGQ